MLLSLLVLWQREAILRHRTKGKQVSRHNLFDMDKKLTRIVLIIFMAFAVCAFVSFEDARESDAAFARGEMLQLLQPELHIQHDVKQIVAYVRPLRTQTQAFTYGGTSSPVLLSLTTCILRC